MNQGIFFYCRNVWFSRLAMLYRKGACLIFLNHDVFGQRAVKKEKVLQFAICKMFLLMF